MRLSPTSQTDLDEAISYVSGGAPIAAAYPTTISAWVQSTSSVPYREGIAFLSNPAGNYYSALSKGLNSSGPGSSLATFERNGPQTGGDFGTSPVLNDGNWHHVVGVLAGPTTSALYVDGNPDHVMWGTALGAFDVTQFRIGASPAMPRLVPMGSFDGLIDDVGVWDEALSDTRVRLIYGLGRFSGVSLDDPSIAQVESVFTNQYGEATAGQYVWHYATGLPLGGGAVGTVDGDPYISLSPQNTFPVTGVRGELVPEPSGIAAILVAAAICSRRRRRAS